MSKQKSLENTVSYRSMMAVAIPVILSNLSIPLLGIVDIAMLGHRGDESLVAALAVGTIIFDLIFWCFSFLRMSTTGLVAQHPKDARIVKRALAIAVFISLVLIISQTPLLSLCLVFIKTNPSVQHWVDQYYSVRIYAALPTLINYVITGFLFGQQNTKASLTLVLITNVTAIALDCLFVFGLGYSIKGLAAANIIAQTTSALLGLYYLQVRYHVFAKATPWASLSAFKTLFSVNRDIFIRSLMLLLTFSYFTRLGAAMGAVVVASNAIILNIHELMAYCLDGVTIALESFVGKAVGLKQVSLFQQSVRLAIRLCAMGAIAFSLLFFFFASYLIRLTTSVPAIQQHAFGLIPWLSCLPIIAIASYLYDGIYIGAVWTKPMRNAMVLAFITFVAITQLFHGLGNPGLWLALYGFLVMRALYLGLAMKKNVARTFKTTSEAQPSNNEYPL